MHIGTSENKMQILRDDEDTWVCAAARQRLLDFTSCRGFIASCRDATLLPPLQNFPSHPTQP